MKRRDLLKAAALGGLVGSSGSRARAQAQSTWPAAPPSDRIRVGMIGVGGFGFGTNLPDFMKNPDVEIAAICDVFEPNLERAVALAGGKAARFRDYRQLLDDRSIDAVVITTPEHWHAIQAIDACDAGKDVYVEKPCPSHQ